MSVNNPHLGTYYDVTQIDESPIMLGECKLKITENQIIFEYATGLKVKYEELRIKEYKPKKEVEELKVIEAYLNGEMFFSLIFVKDANKLENDIINMKEIKLILVTGNIMYDNLNPYIFTQNEQVKNIFNEKENYEKISLLKYGGLNKEEWLK